MAQAAWPLRETQRGFGRDRQARRLVGPAAAHVPRTVRVRRLLDVGRFSGQSLRVRAVPVAVLLAAALRRGASRVVRTEARLVARRPAVFARAADPVGARRLPLHLLLLPRRVLQGVLGRSAVVHGRRAAQVVSRRALVPADPAERAPLFSLSRAALHRRPHLRRVEGDVVHRSGDRGRRLRHRSRDARPGGQRRPARRLHVRLPFAPPSRRRRPRRDLEVLALRRELQRARARSTGATCCLPG